MLASRQHSWEISWWVLVAALALLLVVVGTPSAVYGDPAAPQASDRQVTEAQPPMPVDQMTENWCQAVEAFRSGDFSQAQHALDAIPLREDSFRSEPALVLWRTLVAQARGDSAAAIHGWGHAPLELQAELWRHVGLAAAWLDRGQIDEAAEALDNAWDLQRNNPLVRYQFGLLNLERAHRSADWQEAAEVQFRLVGFGRPKVAPNSAAMYRLAAIGDLEKAIEQTPRLALDAPLLMTEAASPVLAPRVGDLLRAIGALQFKANSHVMLGQLFLEGGNLPLPSNIWTRPRRWDERLRMDIRKSPSASRGSIALARPSSRRRKHSGPILSRPRQGP